METESRRAGQRTPARVAVDLSGDPHVAAQQGITENVSPRGARVLTSHPLQPNERITVRSLLGSLRSRARVVYCEPVERGSFAVGLELFVVTGEWMPPQTEPERAA
jgi:PilZ domain